MTAAGADGRGGEQLERSEQLIDEAKDAAREALPQAVGGEDALDGPTAGEGVPGEGENLPPA